MPGDRPRSVPAVLVVDDEEPILKSISLVLKTDGFTDVRMTSDGNGALEIVRRGGVDIVLLDLMMPGLSGMDMLPIIRAERPEVDVVVVTGKTDVDTAVECMRRGAGDYLTKPVERSRLIATIRRLVENQELRRENSALAGRLISSELGNPDAFRHIIVADPAMKAVCLYVEAIAAAPTPVLVSGETGVGKELIAQAVHLASGREGRFVAVNISGFDDTVFSDTLFGHTKGSYTGAVEARQGLVAAADSGTLFLDEIGDLGKISQIKLLRLMENGEYYTIGSDVPKKSRARIVVATNRDLPTLVEEGGFRRDLYYRLRTHGAHVPRLADHASDIPLLIEHFLQQAVSELDKKKPTVPPELYDLLGAYHFPGNVRELKAMVYDAMARHNTPVDSRDRTRRSGMLSLKSFREAIGMETGGPSMSTTGLVSFSERLPTITQATELLVEEALRRAEGNQTVAAGLLGVTQQALSKRIKRRNV